MEEKKNVTTESTEKLSYEQLENVCHQLSEQARSLYQKLQEANMVNAFKRLDYLFAVVNNKSAFPEDFVNTVVNEIVTTMTVTEEDTTDTKE